MFARCNDIGETTPATEYDVLDIAYEYDGAADFPDNPFNVLAVANAFAGFPYIHIQYDDIDLENAESWSGRSSLTASTTTQGDHRFGLRP